MWSVLCQLDQILRGEATGLDHLREGTLPVRARGLLVLLVLLAASYGVCMGSFALFHERGPVYEQMLASAVKVPALFLLTIAVTFPSLYVFNALVGSRLNLVSVWRLLVASLGVIVAVLASLGPITAFFSVTSTSYPFVVALNVAIFTISGLLGVSFLLQTLHRMSLAVAPTRWRPAPSMPDSSPPAPQGGLEPATPVIIAEAVDTEPGPLDRPNEQPLGGKVKAVFACWVCLFAFVGAQMGWVLRPFVGSPSKDFTWLRPRESNFFQAFFETLVGLLP